MSSFWASQLLLGSTLSPDPPKVSFTPLFVRDFADAGVVSVVTFSTSELTSPLLSSSDQIPPSESPVFSVNSHRLWRRLSFGCNLLHKQTQAALNFILYLLIFYRSRSRLPSSTDDFVQRFHLCVSLGERKIPPVLS